MAPLFGYNTNLRHGQVLFHIQTEDSGREHGHIITHVFVDGGRVLDSRKLSYLAHLTEPDWEPKVKKLMQKQHKDMCIAIRDGHYDETGPPRLSSQGPGEGKTQGKEAKSSPSKTAPSLAASTLLEAVMAEAENDMFTRE